MYRIHFSVGAFVFVFVFVFVYLCVLDVRHVQTSIYIYVEDPCQCGSVVRRRPVRQLPDGNHCLLSTLPSNAPSSPLLGCDLQKYCHTVVRYKIEYISHRACFPATPR